MAQRQLSRVRRLHADRGLRERARGASRADGAGQRRTLVRGGRALAVSPVARRRRSHGPRNARRPHHQLPALDSTQPDTLRRGKEWTDHVPRGEMTSGTLSTRAPFHFEATVRVLQRRPANRVEAWEQGRYLRVLSSADGLALVEV